MDSIDKFAKRMKRRGSNSTDATIRSSLRSANELFSTSPSYYKVEVNGEKVEAIVNRTRDYSQKLVHFRPDYDIQVGSLVNHEDQMYLILEKDKDEIFSFATMEECNSTIKVQVGDKEKILVGTESNGRPVYDYKTNYKDEPCIASDKYYTASANTALPLPDGKIDILLKYQELPNLQMNDEFIMYEKTYKVADVSYTKVYKGEGIVKINAERRENDYE